MMFMMASRCLSVPHNHQTPKQAIIRQRILHNNLFDAGARFVLIWRKSISRHCGARWMGNLSAGCLHTHVNRALIHKSDSRNYDRLEKEEDFSDHNERANRWLQIAGISNYSINLIFAKRIMAARRVMLYLFSRRRSGFNWILDWINKRSHLKCSCFGGMSSGSLNYFMIHEVGATFAKKSASHESGRVSRLGFRIFYKFMQIAVLCFSLLN